jgi:hypothetical protein
MIEESINNSYRSTIQDLKLSIPIHYIKTSVAFEIIAFIFMILFAITYASKNQPEELSGIGHNYQVFHQSYKTLFANQDLKNTNLDRHLFFISILCFYISNVASIAIMCRSMPFDAILSCKQYVFLKKMNCYYYYILPIFPFVNILWYLYIFYALATAMDDLIAMKNNTSPKMRVTGKYLAIFLSIASAVCIPVCPYIFDFSITSSAIIAGIFSIHWPLLNKYGKAMYSYFITFVLTLFAFLILFIGDASIFQDNFTYGIGIAYFGFFNMMTFAFTVLSFIILENHYRISVSIRL